MNDLDKFVLVAQEFTDWCLSPAANEIEEATKALSLLLRLNLQALDLRFPDDMDYDMEGIGANYEMCRKVDQRTNNALPCSNYSSILDPFDIMSVLDSKDDIIGLTTLGDDIGDTFGDLSKGLALYRGGHHAEAEWEFLNSFQTHWGLHVSSAIYILNCWFADTNNWQSSYMRGINDDPKD